MDGDNLLWSLTHLKFQGTFSKDKHEILFTQHDINYNNIEQIYRKGSFVIRQKVKKKGEMRQ